MTLSRNATQAPYAGGSFCASCLQHWLSYFQCAAARPWRLPLCAAGTTPKRNRRQLQLRDDLTAAAAGVSAAAPQAEADAEEGARPATVSRGPSRRSVGSEGLLPGLPTPDGKYQKRGRHVSRRLDRSFTSLASPTASDAPDELMALPSTSAAPPARCFPHSHNT